MDFVGKHTQTSALLRETAWVVVVVVVVAAVSVRVKTGVRSHAASAVTKTN